MGYLSCRTVTAIGTCEDAHRKHKKRPVKLQVFKYVDLEKATGDFSLKRLLGKGSHGCVYKGTLENGKLVAVKRPTFARQLLQDETSFDNELEILSKLWNDRVVNLLGFSRDSEEKLLVVEFMANGTLHDNLHRSQTPMSWPMRVHLALQTARGILSLHSARPPIIHRDIKSSNVMIDDKWNAKLGDFGLALRGHIEDVLSKPTPPAGTLGYLDPEYETPSDLSTKTDVFSFGILLLEIISGRNAIDLAYDPPSILEWALPLIKQGKQVAVCDRKLRLWANFKPLRQMIHLAVKCVRTSSYRRPSMFEVVEDLKEIHSKISPPILDGLTRAVKSSLSAQRNRLGVSSRKPKSATKSCPKSPGLLAQAPIVTEESSGAITLYGDTSVVDNEEIVPDRSPSNFLTPARTPDETPSNPLTPDSSEAAESEIALEDYASANASFRSSNSAATMDLYEDMSEYGTWSSARECACGLSCRGKIKSGWRSLSCCDSPGVSYEMGGGLPCGHRQLNAASLEEPNGEFIDRLTCRPCSNQVFEETEEAHISVTQFKATEQQFSAISSYGDGDLTEQTNDSRKMESEDPGVKAVDEAVDNGVLSQPNGMGGTIDGKSAVCPQLVQQTTSLITSKTRTCLGAARRPCSPRLEGDEDLQPSLHAEKNVNFSGPEMSPLARVPSQLTVYHRGM